VAPFCGHNPIATHRVPGFVANTAALLPYAPGGRTRLGEEHAQGGECACQAVTGAGAIRLGRSRETARHRCGDVDRLVAAEQDGSASLWRSPLGSLASRALAFIRCRGGLLHRPLDPDTLGRRGLRNGGGAMVVATPHSAKPLPAPPAGRSPPNRPHVECPVDAIPWRQRATWRMAKRGRTIIAPEPGARAVKDWFRLPVRPIRLDCANANRWGLAGGLGAAANTPQQRKAWGTWQPPPKARQHADCSC